MNLSTFTKALESFSVAKTSQPIVVFSAVWPLMRALEVPKENLAPEILNSIFDAFGKDRNLLMPSFPKGGYQDGLCNLDSAPSTVGVLSEHFRTKPGIIRSLSAFFSFAMSGPDVNEFSQLLPEFAWGEGSVYEWMEKRDAVLIMLGTHPTHNSYIHRMEWLHRDRIDYRFDKRFTGTLIRNGKKFNVNETLFVRIQSPTAINDFTGLLEPFLKNGMETIQVEGVNISTMSARQMRETVLSVLNEDSHALLKNRDEFKKKT